MAQQMKDCPACNGTGNCQICKGKGKIEKIGKYDEPCKKCNETGRCTRCNGKGVVPKDK